MAQEKRDGGQVQDPERQRLEDIKRKLKAIAEAGYLTHADLQKLADEYRVTISQRTFPKFRDGAWYVEIPDGTSQKIEGEILDPRQTPIRYLVHIPGDKAASISKVALGIEL